MPNDIELEADAEEAIENLLTYLYGTGRIVIGDNTSASIVFGKYPWITLSLLTPSITYFFSRRIRAYRRNQMRGRYGLTRYRKVD